VSGYPPDLLDIDLEADLGIDTVKEAEVFAASATPSTSKATTLSNLGEYPTPARWRCPRPLTA
jgi:hypothetical protein